jgi:predicted PurR-regulated permease PerM
VATCLTVLTAIAATWALQWSAALLVPLLVSGLIALALDPLVRLVQRTRVPRAGAAAIVTVGLVAGSGGCAYGLSDPASEAARLLPDAIDRLRQELSDLGREEGRGGETIKAIREAADGLEAAASEATGAPAPPRPDGIDLDLREWIFVGSMGAVGWVGQLILLFCFVFVLLASGDLYKRKLIHLAGPAMAAQLQAAVTIDEMLVSMRRFMAVTVGLNVALALGVWLAFRTYGVTAAAVWGVLAGALNFIPYVGSAIAAGIFFIAALLQFDDLGDAAVVAGMFVLLSSIEGMVLKPWLIGRGARINSAAIFLGLFFWGWTWGAWGLFLSLPILLVVKVIADHVERLKPLSKALGT